jgi:hypothetical protein
MVSGPQLVGQNVLLFLTTGLGQHPTNPLFGSEFVSDVGGPAPDASAYDVALAECTAYFQALDAQNPQVPLDEQIDHIGDVQTTGDAAGTLGVTDITFTVYVRSGQGVALSTNAPNGPSGFGHSALIWGSSPWGSAAWG